MPLRIDHAVILVADLDQAIADYTALGFSVQPGGTHTSGESHNALIGFADGSYLELIAFLRSAPEHRWGGFHARGQFGLIDWALCPDDVGTVVQACRAQELAYTGPFDGGRLRPDGQRLVWQMGMPPSLDLPFLCGDVSPRTLRVPQGPQCVHANGVRGMASLTVAVADAAASAQRYASLLGLARPPAPLALPGLGATALSLPLGTSQLVLLSPVDGPAAGGQSLQTLVHQRGEGPWGLALSATGITRSCSLALTRTSGAHIDLVPV